MSYQGYPPYGQPPPQQGGYYQQQPPPPQGQQYGAPPSQGQYYPPPQQHGAYGAPPPPASPYGAPAQQPYGAPSPSPMALRRPSSRTGPSPGPILSAAPATGSLRRAATTSPQQPYQQQPYGAQPGYSQAPRSSLMGSSHLMANHHPTHHAHGLRSAMKGFGTDEKALIRILATKDPLQAQVIRDAYTRIHRRNLVADIESETSGWFEAGLVALVRGPLLNDAYLLRQAMDGIGTKEKALNDVLLGRTNADMNAIKGEYQRVFRRRLEDDVRGDLSMKTERHFMIVLGAQRAEESAPVVKPDIDRDVNDLYNATEGKVGTDEMKVCSILSTRNDSQLRAIAYEYKQKYARNLEDVIRKEFSGHMEDALLYQLRNGVDKYMHHATLLEDAMAGAGTKDYLLVSRVVRYHWDRQHMANVRGAYENKYRRNLASRIKGETSGDYERLMLACIGERV
ncbi:hypothetical protein N0V88_002842 [Collariella sp. IMI 366227]|nr:hypothetical protein N0V88_002842 [Collariella sp. IMI 366227]